MGEKKREQRRKGGRGKRTGGVRQTKAGIKEGIETHKDGERILNWGGGVQASASGANLHGDWRYL